MSLATLTKSGRAGMAEALAAMPLHFAWGSGDPAWDADPEQQHLKQSLVNAVALNNELGRRAVTAIGYVTPDEKWGNNHSRGKASEWGCGRGSLLFGTGTNSFFVSACQF